MRRVNNGEWTPKTPVPRPIPASRTMPAPTYRVYATRKFHDWCLEAGVAPEAATDLRWKLSIFLDALGEHPLDEITERMIDLAKLELLAERAAVEAAARDGHPIKETAVGRGRPYQRRKRGLDRNSINKGLKTLVRVLEAAAATGTSSPSPALSTSRPIGRAARSCTQSSSAPSSTPARAWSSATAASTGRRSAHIRESPKSAWRSPAISASLTS